MAHSMYITPDGRTLEYQMPRYSNLKDPTTGELEVYYPLRGDGTVRSFKIVDGQLIDGYSNRVLVNGVILQDPHPDSTQYQKNYKPFTATTIGSRRALTVNLITAGHVREELKYNRMKTTVILRNSP